MKYLCLDCLHNWESLVGDPKEWRCPKFECRSYSIVNFEDILEASKMFHENRTKKRPLRTALENLRINRRIRMKSNLPIHSALFLMEVIDQMATSNTSPEETLDNLRKKRKQ